MKIREFIEKNKIRNSLAVGFIAHMRMDADGEAAEEILEREYVSFSGRMTPVAQQKADAKTKADDEERLKKEADAKARMEEERVKSEREKKRPPSA